MYMAEVGSHQCLCLQQELEVARKRAFSVPSCSSLELPGSGALPCSQLSSHSFMLAGLAAAPQIPQISLLPEGPPEQVGEMVTLIFHVDSPCLMTACPLDLPASRGALQSR